MSDNITKKQIFNQITELQSSLESMEKTLFTIQCVADSQPYAESDESKPLPLEYSPDIAMEKLHLIKEITLEREKTINKMLDFYLKIYQSADIG